MKKEECFEIFERYILNTATDDEVKTLTHWIRNNTEISDWLEGQISTSPNVMDRAVQMNMFDNIKAGLDTGITNVDAKKKITINYRLERWLRIAAMFVLPLLTAAGVYIYMSQAEAEAPLIVSVERGQKACITLPDGSKAWLNSRSKLTYNPDYNKKKRLLQLDGEAYFEVAHNPDKPFIVQSHDICVEALGTAFGVKAYDEDNLISSILMHGKVKVTTPDRLSVLRPNERILYDKITRKTTQAAVTNAVDFTGWIHNELRFENESLGEIAKNIQRIYNVEIIFASERLKNLRYTGTVNNNSLENVLNIITLTSPISFKTDKQRVTLYENRSLMKHYNQ